MRSISARRTRTRCSCITDLLPHLGAKQGEKKLNDAIPGENLNVLVASRPVEDKELENRVKLNVLKMLYEAYGIAEKDFINAEIEVVPAFKARDIGPGPRHDRTLR